MPNYEIGLRDTSTNLIFERLDTWTSLNIIKRFNSIGTWELELSKSSQLARWLSPRMGIVIKRDGVTIFSGSAGTDYIETAKNIKVSGEDDNKLLRGLARPTPSIAEAPYPDEYDVTTGIASTIMRSLVDRNIGPSAPPQWKISDLILATDPLLGSAITARARFDPLITLLSELASTPTATGLGFQILQDDTDTRKRSFSVYQPQDKHQDTKFSIELRTAEDYEYTYTNPAANWFVVAGGDDFGSNRTIVEDGDAASILEIGYRIPAFIDKRGVVDLGELNQALAEQLATVVSTTSITVVPSNDLQYGRDYDLGDYVSIIINGIEYARIIREIAINFDVHRGPIIRPTLADPFMSGDDLLAQHFYTLENRISNIERNFNVPDNSIIGDMIHETQRTYIGDIKLTARGAAQNGWLFCDGTAISRDTYFQLFGTIGTIFGVGDGFTTFNLPNFEDKGPIGAGGLYALGQSGGANTAVVSAHSHTHSHGLNNHTHASQAHTHIGDHSHGPGNLSILHTHQVDIDHTHASFNTGKRNNDSVGALGFNEPGASSGTNDHHHVVAAFSLGTTQKTTTNYSVTSRTGTTDIDSNAPAATYTGSPSVPVPNSSESDSTLGGGVTIDILPPYLAVNFEIYTGVAS